MNEEMKKPEQTSPEESLKEENPPPLNPLKKRTVKKNTSLSSVALSEKIELQAEGSFFIPLNTPSSKNSKRWTGKFLVSSDLVQRWRRIVKPAFEAQTEEFLKSLHKIPKPYKIEFTFIRNSKRKFDYPNPLQTILDEMVKYGWIADDSADEIKPFFGDYWVDKVNAGVYIRILREVKTQ